MREQIVTSSSNEDGASAVEYGLLVVAIAAVIALIVFALGGNVVNLFSSACTGIDSQVSASASCS